jgi:CheY-like chemotaxis protein
MAIIESGAAIDLLFTDVVMPGAFGAPELARRAQRRLPGLRVLFTSGYTDNAIIHGGHLEEGVELLSKPFTQDELARKLRSSRRAPPPRACDGIFRRRRIAAVWADAAGTGSHGARARSSYRAADGREIIRQVNALGARRRLSRDARRFSARRGDI